MITDDTKLYIIVEDPVVSAAVLNHDLSQISSWSKKWLVTCNPSKTESVTYIKCVIQHCCYQLNDQDIACDMRIVTVYTCSRADYCSQIYYQDSYR